MPLRLSLEKQSSFADEDSSDEENKQKVFRKVYVNTSVSTYTFKTTFSFSLFNSYLGFFKEFDYSYYHSSTHTFDFCLFRSIFW